MWILFSLISAVTDASRMAVNKHLSTKSDPYSIFYFMALYSMPFVAVMAYFTFDKLPLDNWHFTVPAVVGALIMAAGSLMLAEANKRCDISIVAPIIGLTPILIVPIEYFLLGTLPNSYGFLGIGLVVFGSYILNFSWIKSHGFIGPFKALFKPGGGLLPFLIAVIFSVGASANKYALQFADAASYSVWLIAGTFMIATLYLFGFKTNFTKFKLDSKLIAKPSWSIFQGLLFSGMIYSELYASSLISASYMIALKRLAALVGVAFGYFVFKEKNIRERAVGASIMVFGVIILVMFG